MLGPRGVGTSCCVDFVERESRSVVDIVVVVVVFVVVVAAGVVVVVVPSIALYRYISLH